MNSSVMQHGSKSGTAEWAACIHVYPTVDMGRGGGGGGWTAREVSVEADGTEPNLQIEN
jgi:hypothetical protein